MVIDMLRYHLLGNESDWWGLQENSICVLCCYVKNVEKDLYYLFCFVDEEAEKPFDFGRLSYRVS